MKPELTEHIQHVPIDWFYADEWEEIFINRVDMRLDINYWWSGSLKNRKFYITGYEANELTDTNQRLFTYQVIWDEKPRLELVSSVFKSDVV